MRYDVPIFFMALSVEARNEIQENLNKAIFYALFRGREFLFHPEAFEIGLELFKRPNNLYLRGHPLTIFEDSLESLSLRIKLAPGQQRIRAFKKYSSFSSKCLKF